MNKFLKEILEQPAALDRTIGYYTGPEGRALLEKFKQIVGNEKFEQIIFTGMGSSYFISHAASCLFNKLGKSSFVINTSELLHYNLPVLEEKTLLICLSQSGESFEVREILKNLPSGVYCVGITNEAESTLAKKADIAFLSFAGKEEMTSTKTYVVTTLVSFIIGWMLAGKWYGEMDKVASRLVGNFKNSLTDYEVQVKQPLNFLGDIQSLQIIARGPAFSTASQSALMFKETARIAAEGILGGEFRHGPMEMVTEEFKSIIFASKGKTFSQSLKMATDISGFGGKVLLITNEETRLSDKNILQVFIDEPDEYLFSIQSIIPVQLFIDYYVKARGFEAGSFSRGAKITVTE